MSVDWQSQPRTGQWLVRHLLPCHSLPVSLIHTRGVEVYQLPGTDSQRKEVAHSAHPSWGIKGRSPEGQWWWWASWLGRLLKACNRHFSLRSVVYAQCCHGVFFLIYLMAYFYLLEPAETERVCFCDRCEWASKSRVLASLFEVVLWIQVSVSTAMFEQEVNLEDRGWSRLNKMPTSYR